MAPERGTPRGTVALHWALHFIQKSLESSTPGCTRLCGVQDVFDLILVDRTLSSEIFFYQCFDLLAMSRLVFGRYFKTNYLAKSMIP